LINALISKALFTRDAPTTEKPTLWGTYNEWIADEHSDEVAGSSIRFSSMLTRDIVACKEGGSLF
jgi:hypothetical protein